MSVPPDETRTNARPAPRVVVVGGGLAGMAASAALESAGADVTLLEARRTLGGRAGSFEDPATGEELDNCQHVLLGCCTNLLDFYRRLGVERLIRYERAVHFLDADGRGHDLYGVRPLPAPLHLGPAMLRFSLLTWAQRAALARAMLAMLRLDGAERAALADVPFGDWLDEHRQPAALVEKLYDPVLISALNEESRRASASAAIHVFQGAMLAHADGYVVGVPDCPLSQLYRSLPCRDVRLGTRAGELCFGGNGAGNGAGTSPARVTGVKLVTGELLRADAVVLATNHHAARRWVPDAPAAADARFRRLDRLESVPILGAHLWFDRPVMSRPHAALVAGPLQWLFRKDADGRAVHGVISAARAWVNRPKDQCLALFERQIRALFPAAKDAVLRRGVVVVEKRATFSPSPGADRFRPPQAPPPGGVAGLYLAGDYTRTGWPATMEGAVRAGYLAAEAVLAGAGRPPRRFLVDDLPVQWPARMLGMERDGRA